MSAVNGAMCPWLRAGCSGPSTATRAREGVGPRYAWASQEHLADTLTLPYQNAGLDWQHNAPAVPWQLLNRSGRQGTKHLDNESMVQNR